MRYLFIFCTLISVAACSHFTPKNSPEKMKENSAKVNEMLDRYFDASVSRNPEFAANLGLKTNYDKWSDRSDKFYDTEIAIMRTMLDSLQLFSPDGLDEQTKLSVRLFEEEVAQAKEDSIWRKHYYPITQMSGEHNDLPSFLINIHQIETKEDATAYITRLQGISGVLAQMTEQLKAREAIKVMPPKFTFVYVANDIKEFIKGCIQAGEENILLTDFTTKVGKINIGKEEQAALIAEAKKVIESTVKSAYESFLVYWNELDQKQTESQGVWALPNGDAYYQYCLKRNTTTSKTPNEVYETGLKEVARIQDEMRVIMKQVNFKSENLQDFFAFVRTDPQFKYSNDAKGKADLLAESNSYIHTFKKTYLPLLFEYEPRSPLVVMEVEKFREKSSGGAFYENPAEDGSRPGRFYVNTYNMNDEPKYQMEALCYHEGLPGHHMQISIAQELTGIPKFRKYAGNTAYIEGWGLYSELIPKEVGLYQDPYSDFGRLSMEIFRAARLVVDVAIHTKKWTREQAITYFMENTANAKGDIEHEIERYFLWPGQATGYKIGMIRILELRAKAKSELGEKFDIKQFHSVILKNGAVPLGILEELVNAWVAEKKKR